MQFLDKVFAPENQYAFGMDTADFHQRASELYLRSLTENVEDDPEMHTFKSLNVFGSLLRQIQEKNLLEEIITNTEKRNEILAITQKQDLITEEINVKEWLLHMAIAWAPFETYEQIESLFLEDILSALIEASKIPDSPIANLSEEEIRKKYDQKLLMLAASSINPNEARRKIFERIMRRSHLSANDCFDTAIFPTLSIATESEQNKFQISKISYSNVHFLQIAVLSFNLPVIQFLLEQPDTKVNLQVPVMFRGKTQDSLPLIYGLLVIAGAVELHTRSLPPEYYECLVSFLQKPELNLPVSLSGHDVSDFLNMNTHLIDDTVFLKLITHPSWNTPEANKQKKNLIISAMGGAKIDLLQKLINLPDFHFFQIIDPTDCLALAFSTANPEIIKLFNNQPNVDFNKKSEFLDNQSLGELAEMLLLEPIDPDASKADTVIANMLIEAQKKYSAAPKATKEDSQEKSKTAEAVSAAPVPPTTPPNNAQAIPTPPPAAPISSKIAMVNIDLVIKAIKEKRIDRRGGASNRLAKFLSAIFKPTRLLKKQVSQAFIQKLESLKGEDKKTTEVPQETMNKLLSDFAALQKHVEIKRSKAAKKEAVEYLSGKTKDLPQFDQKKNLKGQAKEDIREAAVRRKVYDSEYKKDEQAINKGVDRYNKKMLLKAKKR